jgi:hypothetical protein
MRPTNIPFAPGLHKDRRSKRAPTVTPPMECGRYGCSPVDQRRELPDVVDRLGRQLPAARQILLVARRTGIVGGKEAALAKAVEHLAQIGGSGQDVVARLERIVAETRV